MTRRLRGKPTADVRGQSAADHALRVQDRKLEKVHGETGEILDAAATLKRLGERNDFAARIKHSLGG